MDAKHIIEELEAIRAMRDLVQKNLDTAPSGHIRCGMNKGKYPVYYLAPSEKQSEKTSGKIGTYIKRSDLELARKLAQKEYDRKVLSKLLEEERILEKSLKYNHLEAMKEIHDKLPEAKKRLVKPYVLSDEEFVKEWKAGFVSEANDYPMSEGYQTEAGEVVRSKSEKMIADKLFYQGIPYVYESPLRLKRIGIVYPDFTLLNVRTRKTYYHEHFGMMDNPEYCAKNLNKVDAYEESGIYLGEKLLITMESSQRGINMQEFDRLIQRYLK